MNSLIQILTNNETFFFREMHHFEVLRDRVLPELLALGRRSLRAWSAGCSTGEEAYSLAIALLDYQTVYGEFPVRLIATDIDSVALEIARRGCYNRRAIRQVPDDLYRRYFYHDGLAHCVSPEVARLIKFEVHNLAEESCPPDLTNLDIIFCRNVTIYFDDEARDRLNARLARSLREGGYLFVASAETMGHNRGRMELVSAGSTFLFRQGVPGKKTGFDSAPDQHQARPATEAKTAGRLTDSEPRQGRAVVSPTPAPAPQQVASVLERAWAAFQRQDYDAALRELDPVSFTRPLWIEACCLRGAILLQQERLAEAEAACQTLLAHDPWYADAHFLIGLVFRQQGNMKMAVQSLKQAIYLEPSHRHAHFYLAETYRALELDARARREYDNTLNALEHRSESVPNRNLTGLQDEILRQACEANLRKLSSA
jgi:chemotaxis protein methyltransferase CheR